MNTSKIRKIETKVRIGKFMQENQIVKIQCIRIETDSRRLKEERVAAESLLALYVNGMKETSFSYSRGLEKELVFGYLISTGIVVNEKEIENFTVDNSTCNVSISRQKKKPSKKSAETFSELKFSKLIEIRNMLLQNQEYQKVTRGFHGAILWDISTDRWFACEDIGRHNAIDKVIGHFVLAGYSRMNSVLLISGRLISDIVEKGKKAGIPVIASMTVSSDLGIKIAIESNLTLIGGLTGQTCWLYNEGFTKLALKTQ